jgi:uncharacterized protein (UPF0147 family)
MGGFKANSGLTAKQEKAIGCLLSEATVAGAAAKAAVGETTLRRWMSQPEFNQAYRKARMVSFGETLRLLRRSATSAVVTLVSIMQDKTTPKNTRIRAAEIILDHDRKGVEIEDIEARLSELEGVVQEQGGGK